MTKYILVLILMSGLLLAQQNSGDPTTSLDRPLSPVSPSLMKIRVVGNYFNNWSIAGIIQTLATMRVGSDGSIWSHYYVDNPYTSDQNEADNASILKAELMNFYNNFPQGAEVFSASLNNGHTGYVDTYGYNIQNGSSQNQTYDDYIGTAEHSYNLNFYAGRNTAAGDSSGATSNASESTSEVIITTSTGNEYKIYAYDTTTPLVLDMDGDGKLEASNGEWLVHELKQEASCLKEFDINGDGFDELVEWVGVNDGLLLTYTPGEKVTGNNLFGVAKGYVDGFEKLSTLDADKDGKITGEELKTLSVWQDKNSNAIADDGEIVAVQELGITEIGVRHTNLISYFVQNDKNLTVWDWNPVMMMVKKDR